MEAEVRINSTSEPDTRHPCYELYNFKLTPSVMCVSLFIFQTSLSVVTICGNLLVMIAIIYFKQLHTPTNYLIMSLAMADLLTGIIVCPMTIAFSLTTCAHSGRIFCNLRGSADTSLNSCSLLNLGCISIDRYYAVCHPLTYRSKISHHNAAIMILLSWGFTALVGISDIYFFFGNECNVGCEDYHLILLFVMFFLPLITTVFIFCIYLKIFIVAQRQVRSILNTNCQSTKSGATVSNKMEKKATKTLAIVLGVYLLCWFPYFLSNFIAFITNDSISTPLHVKETLIWIKLLNSMFNPFIYAFFYSWFRSAIRMIISGKIFQGDFRNSQLH